MVSASGSNPKLKPLFFQHNQVGERAPYRLGFVYSNLFFSRQDHRIGSEGTPGGDQGRCETYAEHGKNDAAEDDQIQRIRRNYAWGKLVKLLQLNDFYLYID
jgi:hypothetical protein